MASKGNRLVVFVSLICFSYVLLRYVGFKGVPVIHIPVFLLNKALAFSSVCLFAITVFLRATGSLMLTRNERKTANGWATIYAVLHVLLSLIVLNPSYLPALFIEGRFTAYTEVALLAGVLSIVSLFTYQDSWYKSIADTAKKYVILLLVLHVTLLGAKSVLANGLFDHYSVPVSVLSVCALLFAGAVSLLRRGMETEMKTD